MDRIILCGCLKNCGKYLDNVFKNIKNIQNYYNIIEIVLFYDTSEDETLNKLKELSLKFNITILSRDKLIGNIRCENICTARNEIMRYLKTVQTFDYFIMMDMDDVCSSDINISVIHKAFNLKNEWDAVSFNNDNYYDFWALSFDIFNFSFWHTICPEKIIKMAQKRLKEVLNNCEKYIECDSAFNGFAIYKWEKFKHCFYDINLDFSFFPKEKIDFYLKNNLIVRGSEYPDCEHRKFHLNAKKQGAKIIILKDILFPNFNK